MPRADLRELFANLQDELAAKLKSGRSLPHGGVQGETSESGWIEMLNDQLPRRYCASRGMVVDCDGETSEQIDVVVHDQQYSPLLFRRGQQLFVPAESVYAVLEVKPALDAGTLRYAAEKAASVRRLRRTSAGFPTAGEDVDRPKKPFEILAGIVSDRNGWSGFGETFVRHLGECRDLRRIDLGCALRDGAFSHRVDRFGEAAVEVAPARSALVYFFVELLARLQRLGTVPAIDYAAYRRVLGAEAAS